MTNVAVAVFEIESEGYQAITELKKAPLIGNTFVSEAALVKKAGGAYQVLDSFDTGAHTVDDTMIGSLVGMCIGVLGGPVGMLLGASLGSLAGLTTDTVEAVMGASMIEQIAGKLVDDEVALIALADEEAEVELDDVLSKYKVIIARFDAAVVAQEVEKAREMQAEMERLARIELRKQKSDEFKGKVDDRRSQMKAKLAELKEKLAN